MGQQRSVRGGNGRACFVRVLQWVQWGKACGCERVVGWRRGVDKLEAVSGRKNGGRSNTDEGCMRVLADMVGGTLETDEGNGESGICFVG
eukprot:1804637-Prorocentrum_lima.AAC.1